MSIDREFENPEERIQAMVDEGGRNFDRLLEHGRQELGRGKMSIKEGAEIYSSLDYEQRMKWFADTFAADGSKGLAYLYEVRKAAGEHYYRDQAMIVQMEDR